MNASEQWALDHPKKVREGKRHKRSLVESDQRMSERKREFALALAGAGGDVVVAARGLGLSYRIAQGWARSAWYSTWRDAYVAEVTQAVQGRLPRVYEQIFQNAYGSLSGLLRVALSDDPVGEYEKLSAAQQGQAQEFTVNVDAKGNKTVKVKAANRDRSGELAMAILGVDKAKAVNGDRPVFTVNVMVAGGETATVDVTPSATLLA